MISIDYSLIDIIRKQKAEFQGFSGLPYTPRIKEEELKKTLSSSLIKVIMGPRRAGKSRLIQKVLEKYRVAYLNFEEEQFLEVTGDQIIEAAHEVYPHAEFWYLDEIQDFPQWEILLNKLQRRRYNLVITGSNANLLSAELASALTGRHLSIELLPFSYGEYLTARKEERGWNSFEQYLHTGGFPEVVLSSIDTRNYLTTLFDSIVLKDLVKRKKIRNPRYLTNCISLMMNNIASRTSARSLAKALQQTPTATTIEKYIEMCQEAYLLESIGAYHPKTKSRIQSERKPYTLDTGFIDAKSKQVLPLLSKQLENSVYLTLRRRGKLPEISLFYYRGENEGEVDFLLRDGHRTTELVQVCLDMTALKTREREVYALSAAQERYPDAMMTIVTANESGSISLTKRNIIRVVPAYEFCE